MDAMLTLTFLMVLQIFVGAYSFEDIRNNNFADAFDDVSLADPYNDEEPNFNYELLNNVVKRQSKGSCSCTCETKSVAPSHNDQQQGGDDQDEGPQTSKPVVGPQMLRTAVKPYTPTKSLNQVQDKIGAGIMKPLKYARPPAAESLLLSPDAEVMRPSTGNNWNKADGSGENHEPVKGDEKSSKTDEEKKPTINRQGGSESWGHGSRFPWKRLPDRVCFRERCVDDKDCCLRFNICDRSARICVDCWYGSACRTEQQCCQKYPYCQIDRKIDRDDKLVETGKCVDKL